MIRASKTKIIRKNPVETLPITEATVFDGKEYALDQEKILVGKVKELKALGVTPKVVAIITQKDQASVLYVKLKQKAAQRVGIEMEVYELFSSRRDYKFLFNLIGVMNRDQSVHGIMIQLPLAKRFKPYQDKILNTIDPKKDVDGLTNNSPFVPATVKAVLSIITIAERQVLLRKPPPVFIAGSEGAVGSALMKYLEKRGYSVKGYDIKKRANWRGKWGVPPFMSVNADVVVSATGTPGIIEARHVAKGAAVIDVGSPKGDVRFREVASKASFITPVPGGVGPVTIVSLLENTVEAAYNSLSEQHI